MHMSIRVQSPTNLSAENPPKTAPLAMPTQNPMMKPVFILSKHVGPCWENELVGRGMPLSPWFSWFTGSI